MNHIQNHKENSIAPDDRLSLEDEIKKEILELSDSERATLLDAWKCLFAQHLN